MQISIFFIASFLTFDLFPFITRINSRMCKPRRGDCVAENVANWTTACPHIFKNCTEEVDHFGENKKYQCHCKELKFCNLIQNVNCKGQECMVGYEGPNCQKRWGENCLLEDSLYHKFLLHQSDKRSLFKQKSNRTCGDLPQTINFRHIYRIQQIELEVLIPDTITHIFGFNNQSLQCEHQKEVTKLLCSGDMTTNGIQITNSCITNIKLFGCSPGWFGEECTKKCHCQNDSDCHQLTGVCQHGCEMGWYGDNCQNVTYENIAVGRPVFQSSIKKRRFHRLPSDGNLVVDGIDLISERMCSLTKYEKKPFLVIKLEKNYTISHLRIHRNNLFKLVVFIGANKEPCYRGTKKDEDSNVIVVTCIEPQVGDTVKITIAAKFGDLNLCEVEVLQCLPGFYGQLCRNRKPYSEREYVQNGAGDIKSTNQDSCLWKILIPIATTIFLVFCLGFTYKLWKAWRYKSRKQTISNTNLSSSSSGDLTSVQSDYLQPIATTLNQQNILMYVQQRKIELEPFSKEFSDLPYTVSFPCIEAKKPENKHKNRFNCLLPYDHSRIVLKADEYSTSDYINASFIDNKRYISTQVPMTKTMTDFWRMIWQQNCSIIVLLTNDKQPGYVQHLPQVNSSVNFGSIRVQGVLYNVHKNYTVSKYALCQPDSKPFVMRSVTHFNFTSWPEGMIPSNPECIINFRQKVNSCSDLKYPIVVQSKAGAGSTGTYICLDILLKKFEQNIPLNASYSIRQLYNERSLIFTQRVQLEFVYDVLTESMLTAGCDIKMHHLKEEIDRISVKDRTTELSIADNQFMNIIGQTGQDNNYICDLLEELYTSKCNLSTKNYQISLIEGYEEDKFILAMSPDQHSFLEFLNIINKHSCFTIVTFRDRDNEILSYLPKKIGCSLDFGPFNLELINFIENDLFQRSVLRISFKKEESSYYTIVNHFDATFWPDKHELPPCKDMLCFIEAVSQQNSRDMAIAVHCRDGCTKSGLFIGLYSIICMVKAEQSSVNFVRFLRQMKKSQPKIVPDKTSYTYCLNVVKTFLEKESYYSEAL